MRIESKPCHISDNKAVVRVKGWLNEKPLGSALAEGPTAEIAEDRAIERLKQRENILNNYESDMITKNENKNKKQVKIDLPKSDKLETITLKNEPSDWSNELSSIDTEIERLNWTRDDEKRFLEKNLGINDRNKITKYNEIINYLSILKNIENTNVSDLNIISMESMIKESDEILRDLSWDNKKGR